MQSPIYENEVDYIKSKTDIQAELAAIEEVRTALLAQLLVVATGKPVTEYFLNDGHTTIKRVYTSRAEIMACRKALEEEANTLRRSLRGGGVARAIAGKNLTGRTR